jgi:dienelactone hydrolase
MTKLFQVFTILLLSVSPALAGEDFHYMHEEQKLSGFVAYPDENVFLGQRPVVLIAHQWKGLGEYEKRRAEMLAELGYIAFAIDVYGENIRPKTNQDASAESDKYKNNPDLARGRMTAALDAVQDLKNADTKNIAVLGYCFGGTMALELARSGADFDTAVSFHGGLKTLNPASPDQVKAKIQIHHGAADPYVPNEEVNNFKEEMKQAGADWHFISYADAVHSFTEKEAGNDPSQGVAYNEAADKRSWAYTLTHLEEIFE